MLFKTSRARIFSPLNCAGIMDFMKNLNVHF